MKNIKINKLIYECMYVETFVYIFIDRRLLIRVLKLILILLTKQTDYSTTEYEFKCNLRYFNVQSTIRIDYKHDSGFKLLCIVLFVKTSSCQYEGSNRLKRQGRKSNEGNLKTLFNTTLLLH